LNKIANVIHKRVNRVEIVGMKTQTGTADIVIPILGQISDREPGNLPTHCFIQFIRLIQINNLTSLRKCGLNGKSIGTSVAK
jgi:hypothetical protein